MYEIFKIVKRREDGVYFMIHNEIENSKLNVKKKNSLFSSSQNISLF